MKHLKFFENFKDNDRYINREELSQIDELFQYFKDEGFEQHFHGVDMDEVFDYNAVYYMGTCDFNDELFSELKKLNRKLENIGYVLHIKASRYNERSSVIFDYFPDYLNKINSASKRTYFYADGVKLSMTLSFTKIKHYKELIDNINESMDEDVDVIMMDLIDEYDFRYASSNLLIKNRKNYVPSDRYYRAGVFFNYKLLSLLKRTNSKLNDIGYEFYIATTGRSKNLSNALSENGVYTVCKQATDKDHNRYFLFSDVQPQIWNLLINQDTHFHVQVVKDIIL